MMAEVLENCRSMMMIFYHYISLRNCRIVEFWNHDYLNYIHKLTHKKKKNWNAVSKSPTNEIRTLFFISLQSIVQADVFLNILRIYNICCPTKNDNLKLITFISDAARDGHYDGHLSHKSLRDICKFPKFISYFFCNKPVHFNLVQPATDVMDIHLQKIPLFPTRLLLQLAFSNYKNVS